MFDETIVRVIGKIVRIIGKIVRIMVEICENNGKMYRNLRIE